MNHHIGWSSRLPASHAPWLAKGKGHTVICWDRSLYTQQRTTQGDEQRSDWKGTVEEWS